MRKLKLNMAIVCFAFFGMYGQLLQAQYEPNKKLPIDEKVKIGRLSNGLTYYIQKNVLPAKKVQLRLVVNVGSVLEDADQQGLAHFMEHMNFNGLKHFPKNELVNYLQTIGVKFGADLNAYTGFDETVYILPIPTDDPEKVEKGFTILEDWAFNALLDTAEINKERGVVLEESRLGKGAGERMRNKYFPMILNGSQYAKRIPIGTDSILQNFKPSSLIRFYKTWYRPNLMSVIVVGDIDPEMIEKQIQQHFAAYQNPPNEKPRPSIIEISPRVKNESMVLTDKEQPFSILQVFNYTEKDKPIETWGDYRQSVIEGLFNSMISQRLNELTQQPNAPFLQASASLGEFIRGYRAFTSFAVIGDKPTKDGLDAIIAATESVKKYGFLATELQRAKTRTLTSSERSYNDRDKTESDRIVDQYVSHFLEGNPIVGVSNNFAFLKNVLPTITLEEVNEVAKKMESSQGFFALLMGAEKNKATLPSNEDLTGMVSTAKKTPVKAYEENAMATTLMEKLPVAGKIISQTNNVTLGSTDLTFSNGVTVTLKPTEFKTDEIQMDGWRLGGSRNYGLADKKNAEKAALLVRTMGVKDMTPIDLRKFLTGKTVNIKTYINANDEGIDGTSSAKDFETFLQLAYLNFLYPRKDAALFQTYVSAQKSQLENIKSIPNAYFSDTLSKIMYGNNPWSNGLETIESYSQLNLDRSMEIYKEIFSNAYGMHFTFVGNIDVEKIKPLLAIYLGSLPSKPKENKFTDVGLRPVKGVVELIVKKGAAKQSNVNIIFTGDANYSKDQDLRLKVLIEVLNIGIIEKLREEMGGIYGGGMNSVMNRRPYGNYQISASFPCGPENVDKLTAALFSLINSAKEKGVDQKDLDKVKETLKKQNDDIMKTNAYWLRNLSYAFIENYDPSWFLGYETNVNAITIADLQQTANQYLNMNNYIKAILNPEN